MIGLILLLGLILRLISLNQSFWLDETAQAVLSRAPIFSVNYAADFQPPLYYVFSHFWMMLGNLISVGHNEWFLRLPSVFFGVATIYFTFLLGKKLFDEKTGLLAAGFLSIAPFHVYFSQEFRMYSLLTLLCLLSWNAVVSKKWIPLAIITTLSIFTHYFAFVNVVAMGTYLLTTKEKRGFGYLMGGLIPFALWIPTFIEQLQTAKQLVSLWPKWSEVSNVGFVKFFPLLIAKWTVGMISPENRTVYAISVALFALISGGVVMTKRHSRVLLYYGLLPLFIAWLGGLWLPAATPVRVQFVLPAIYLLIAFGCMRVVLHDNSRNIGLVLIAVFCSIQLFFTLDYLFQPKHHREDWRGAIAYSDKLLEEKKTGSSVALTIFDNKWAPMDWYSRYPEKYHGGVPYSKTFEKDRAQKVVLFTYLFEVFDANTSVENSLAKDYSLVEEKDFRGVGIVRSYIKK